MALDRYRYIVVEGPIGTGKTSLAKKLAERLQSELMLENAETNPFLAKFYQDGRHYALPTQLFFLFQRIAQVQELKQMDLFSRATVADFLLDKDPLFARLNLSDDELALYRQIFEHMRPQAPAPDLVIYLQAPPDVLMDRVRQRGIGYEQSISENYLARLASSYSDFFYHYNAAPLLIVNNENLNIIERAGDFDLLLERIGQMRGGREFFNLADTF
ncbi:MAG: deoxynucleoside kinase [Sulfuricellaceae bacterium]|nr:deoxynucleoside kinase [Sulfuricellaceae bacterium]